MSNVEIVINDIMLITAGLISSVSIIYWAKASIEYIRKEERKNGTR